MNEKTRRNLTQACKTVFIIAIMIVVYPLIRRLSISSPLLFEIGILLLILFSLMLFFIEKKISFKGYLVGVGIIGVIVAVVFMSSYLARTYHPRPMTFSGDSTKLSRTQIVPTLDTPIQSGKNVIWCASFQAVWKDLQDNILNEPVRLNGALETCARLNDSFSPEIPDGELYTKMGYVKDGILDTIRKDKTVLFSNNMLPDFSNSAAPDAYMIYAYLQSKYAFRIPYFDNQEAITFKDPAGNETPVKTFGIRDEERYAYGQLREQVKVLYARFGEPAPMNAPEAFALDLDCTSETLQIVFARFPLRDTLKATLDEINDEISKNEAQSAPEDRWNTLRNEEFGISDILLVPEMAFHLMHSFGEVEGQRIENKTLTGMPILKACQDIDFRLDRSGMELRSEAYIVLMCGPTYYAGDKPFLLYVKKRGAEWPYFVVWIDNDELLTKW